MLSPNLEQFRYDRKREFWSSWFNRLENGVAIEGDHKTGSRTLKAATWCLVCLQTFGKVLNPIKSHRKLKTQATDIGSGETAVLEMPLQIALCCLFPVNDCHLSSDGWRRFFLLLL